MFHLGQTELIVVLVVVLLFGVGRIGKIAAELGSGIHSFKEGLSGEMKIISDSRHCAYNDKHVTLKILRSLIA